MENQESLINNPWFLLLSSLAYSHFLVAQIPKGISRFIFLTPIFYIFYIIPWYFSSSFIRGVLSYFVSWIASFKLLLCCFNNGPLVSCTNYIEFVLVSLFPMKINENAKSFGRFELLQLFNKPYLAMSLQEFWGRRWNRLSSTVLRQTVYEPIWKTLSGRVGIRPAKRVGMISTLVVSGIMHEIMFYHITCSIKPNWEVFLFFVLHGFCMVLEGGFQYLVRAKGWDRPVHPVSLRVLTVGFVLVTFYWLLVLPVWGSVQSDCGFIYKLHFV